MIENFETVLLIVLVCVALALIGLVLIQQGKGADAGRAVVDRSLQEMQS